MIRKIIQINTEQCNGCGLCIKACHEGAIGMIDGKSTLLRDDYCDGLGDCLPVCPTGAIAFIEREALAYNEAEVKRNMSACGCPSTKTKTIIRAITPSTEEEQSVDTISQLNQWPVQIKLVPINAAYFDEAKLLIAADCSAYAYANFHKDFIKGKIALIGCPKLDQSDYAEKLTVILSQNKIKSITVVRMEVPCCGGIENAVMQALQNCGKMIPWQVVTIATNGQIVDR